MPNLPNAIEVVTLFVHPFPETRAFYEKVFVPEIVYEDDVSAVLGFSGTMVNLLAASEAGELVTPTPVASPGNGVGVLLTIKVEDVDAVCAHLATLGVPLLNGPMDRPWGRRTAAFADPSGHIWEIAQEIG